jgi:hypothetical protein
MVDSRAATEAEAEQAIANHLEQAEKEWSDPETQRHLKALGVSGQNGDALHQPE